MFKQLGCLTQEDIDRICARNTDKYGITCCNTCPLEVCETSTPCPKYLRKLLDALDTQVNLDQLSEYL